MIHTIRLELADTLARLAWAVAPRTGIASTYELPSMALRRRTRINRQWTTNLRTTLRSFLFNGPHVTIVKSADTALCRFIAECRSIVAKRHTIGPTATELVKTFNRPKAFPPTR